ncbi:MAG: ABC transporter ATP-binding protein [Alphaproteobacteria bacterium]|nr:ABC transporter ATP-binding protein [Alphaproteobacteria bacterium]
MEIILNNVKKTIKKATVIDGISAKWTGGKVYGLCGYNGCGKTMLMRLVAGLIRPTEGSVTIDGKELGKDIDFPESIGLMIENPAFLDHYTAMQNLQLVASLKKKATREDCIDALKRVNLDPNDLRTFKKFSLGMKQRLGIAAAIFEKPDLILLDEPTNALDADGTELAAKIIREERERGALIILACHERQFLENAADEVIKIEHGQFVEDENETEDEE